MWIYVDKNLVLGTNPNDMSGNTGWILYDGEIAEPLFDGYGIPLYAYENGVLRERSEEERASDRPVRMEIPTEAERLDALECAFTEFVEVMIGG